MKKILFVDDDPAVLDGLQDSLHRHRQRWNMTFACGGMAAIKELNENEYDVIVSDVRMPEVSGVDVLNHAKTHRPNTARIALTGFADETSTIQLTELAQRYLTKPCSVHELDEVISRDCTLIHAFDNPLVKEIAGAAGRLPAGTNIQAKLLKSLNASDGSIDTISSIVEQDPGLTAKILQLANSSFFRRQASIVSAQHAVSHLGLDVIRSLVIADQLFERSNSLPKMDYFDVSAMRKHSFLCSSIAKEISPDPETASVAMTAGLLHDVGKFVIALERTDMVSRLVRVSNGAPYTWVSSEHERDLLGCTHAEIGGYFLNLWGVPTAIVEAVTFHDTPEQVNTKVLDAVGIVHISNYLAHWALIPETNDYIESKINRSFLDRLDVFDKELQWKEIAKDIVAEVHS